MYSEHVLLGLWWYQIWEIIFFLLYYRWVHVCAAPFLFWGAHSSFFLVFLFFLGGFTVHITYKILNIHTTSRTRKTRKTKSKPPKLLRELRIHVPIDNTKGKKIFPKFDTTRDPGARVHCSAEGNNAILTLLAARKTRKTKS